jgi:protein-tyrosine phosphatase
MTTHTISRTAVAALAAATLSVGLVAPATAATHHGSNAKHLDVVPFTVARVSDTADGGHAVTWKATGKKQRVTVYVASTPSGHGTRIARRGSAATVKLPAAPSGRRQFVRLVPERGAALVVADRELGLASAPNLRDVGGYRTSTGQWVRTGVVYRSAALTLTSADKAVVDRLGISVDSDLRMADEIAKAPDVVPAGARYQHLDVIGGSGASYPSITDEASAQHLMIQGERQMVTGTSAQQAYHSLLTDIAWTDGASLYHCTAGKDRTGWASAVLLTLLGVPEKRVKADYLLSNDYYFESPAVQAQLAAMPPAQAAIYRHLMDVEPEYLQAGFDQVRDSYGTMAAYARKGLGLSAATIKQLRTKLLVGARKR